LLTDNIFQMMGLRSCRKSSTSPIRSLNSAPHLPRIAPVATHAPVSMVMSFRACLRNLSRCLQNCHRRNERRLSGWVETGDGVTGFPTTPILQARNN